MKALSKYCFILLLLVTSGVASAQATTTGSQMLRGVQIGATYSFVYPDYSPQDAVGYGMYADAGLIGHYGLSFALHEVSINQHPGAHERSYEFGLRRSFGSSNYQPYVGVDLGHGTFQFAPQFLQQGQTLGYFLSGATAGMDVLIRPHFTVRGEVDYQHWNASAGLPNGLTPILYTVGAAYRFGFRDPER